MGNPHWNLMSPSAVLLATITYQHTTVTCFTLTTLLFALRHQCCSKDPNNLRKTVSWRFLRCEAFHKCRHITSQHPNLIPLVPCEIGIARLLRWWMYGGNWVKDHVMGLSIRLALRYQTRLKLFSNRSSDGLLSHDAYWNLLFVHVSTHELPLDCIGKGPFHTLTHNSTRPRNCVIPLVIDQIKILEDNRDSRLFATLCGLCQAQSLMSYLKFSNASFLVSTLTCPSLAFVLRVTCCDFLVLHVASRGTHSCISRYMQVSRSQIFNLTHAFVTEVVQASIVLF